MNACHESTDTGDLAYLKAANCGKQRDMNLIIYVLQILMLGQRNNLATYYDPTSNLTTKAYKFYSQFEMFTNLYNRNVRKNTIIITNYMAKADS